MDGGNHYSNDESIIRNTLNTNQDSNRMFDVQSTSSLQDSKTIHEYTRTVSGGTTTPQQQLFGKSSSFNTTSLVLPLNGLNFNSTTTSTAGGGGGTSTIPSFNVSSTNSGRQYVSDTTSVQTLDSSKNRIGPTEYQLMMDSHKDDNHLLIQHQQQQQLVSSNNNQLVYNSNTSSMSNIQLGFQATAPPTHVGSGGQTVIQPSNNDSLLLSNVSSHLSNSNNMFISSSSQSANSIHFNTKQSMSNIHSTTEGIFVPNSNTLVSNNNTILHVNELLSNNNQKNMQNGSLPSSSMEQHHQPLNANNNNNNNTIRNSTNANIPFQINQLANFPNATMHVHPHHPQQQLNANIPTLQMVTNQQTNISNVDAFTSGNSNSMNNNNYLNQIASLEVTCSGGMQEETMLKLDLEDFVKTLNSEDYRGFNVSNNSNVNNLQHVQISIPSTLSSNVSHHHLQQQQQHANPTPNFVPSSNLLNNPNLSNNANNNLLYILPPQQMHLHQHQQPIMYPRVGALNLGSTSSHVSSHSISNNNQPNNNITHQNITPASIVKFIPSQQISVNPTLSSIIPQQQISSFSTTSTPPQPLPLPPPQRSNSTPNTTNSGNIVNNFEPHKEFVIHENEYDRKKAPKSKKRQSVDYCNQKKMEFKMEITKQPPAVIQIVTSSSSVLTGTVTSPRSNATPTGQNIHDFDEDPQEENK